jgi:hypothetical protein
LLPQDVLADHVAAVWSNLTPQAGAQWGDNPMAFAYAVERATSLRRA